MAAGPDEGADWPFVRHGAVTLFRSAQVLADAAGRLRSAGYVAARADCADPDALVDGLADALRWEAQFGYRPTRLNLDALNDALRGTREVVGPRALLVLDNLHALHARDAALAHGLLDVIEYQARDLLLEDCRLLAFARSNDPGLHMDGLGGRAAQWNPAEWLHADRGLGTAAGTSGRRDETAGPGRTT